MKLAVFPFVLLAVSAEVISSRDLQEGSDFPSLVPTVSPPPSLMMMESDPPSDLSSDIVSDTPTDGTATMPPSTMDVTTSPPAPVSDSLTTPPSVTTGDTEGTSAPTVTLDLASSSFVASSCLGLAMTVAGLAL